MAVFGEVDDSTTGGGGGTGGTQEPTLPTFVDNNTPLNNIMWTPTNNGEGINSVLPSPTDWNPTTIAQYGNSFKPTKYITELIAMDFGKLTSDPKGMDYRTKVTLNTDEEVGTDSPYPSKIDMDVNMNNGPLGNPWPNWLRELTREGTINTLGNYGTAPGEFISCSGHNQTNNSLAARTYQIFRDDIIDTQQNDNTMEPHIDSTVSNVHRYRPHVFNKNTVPFSNENPNKLSNAPSITDIMTDRISLEGIVDGSTSTEKGIPMGLFFETSKFIVERDKTQQFTSTNNSTNTTTTYNDVTYRLKAGFRMRNKTWFTDENFNPNRNLSVDKSGIHLGGNNTTNPYVGDNNNQTPQEVN